ncbi:MAG: xanthine dehydrogenase family protein subunit M [Candidatus Eisenbacteria bacterium]|nr:xanthine dehydrogenase family protein subunit M [Candidatus Eisenbacteria bacterium]
MRSALSKLDVARARNLAEAISWMEMGVRLGRPWTPLAGGTDLFVYLNAGTQPDARFLDLWLLQELRGQRKGREGLRLGALETFTRLRQSPQVRRSYPALAAAASVVGAIQIQNRGTLGGNLANASPAGDSPPVLLALGASVRLAGPRGTRDVPMDGFFTGYRATVREPDELIHSVLLPPPPRGARQFFRKVGTRQAQSISKVVLASEMVLARGRIAGARVALGSVAPTVIRSPGAEEVLTGEKPTPAVAREAARRLAAALRPIDDVRSTAAYRRSVAARLLELAVAELT